MPCEVIHGPGDVPAIAEAGVAFRWRRDSAGTRNGDRVRRREARLVAWLSAELRGYHDDTHRPHLGRKYGRLSCISSGL